MQDRLRQLYERYGASVYARCRQVLGHPEAAEDAMHDIFVKVHHNLPRVPKDEGGEALRWIYRVTTNHCLNHLRDQRRRLELQEENAPAPTLEAAWEEGMLNRQIARRLMRHLDPKLAEPAWLYYVDGVDQGEVAQMLGVSRRTVINRLNAFKEEAQSLLAAEATT